MTHLYDLFDIDSFHEEVALGHVTERRHPSLPLRIYNYSKQTAYDQHWNDITETCRGLIATDDGVIVARPLRKFYNYEESRAHRPDARAIVTAFDKLDGSLGILYPDERQRHGYAVATRGSFLSDQAVWATKWLNDRDDFPWTLREYLRPDFTPLVEIIYPDNRIVLDYGSRAELVYLGDVVIETGEFTWFPEEWNGAHAEIVQRGRFEDIRLLPDRDNAEGLVVYDWQARKHVKLKQQDYLALHKLISGLNERAVFEALREGPESYDAWHKRIPEEFHDWADGTALTLVQEYVGFSRQYSERLNELLQDFGRDYEDLPEANRGDYARYMNVEGWEKWQQAAFWQDLDGKDSIGVLWKQVELNIKERNKSE